MDTGNIGKTTLGVGLLAVALVAAASITSPTADESVAATVVSGHQKQIEKGANGRFDQDENGIPDVGVSVNGHYTSIYAYDDGNWYWDLGDGRIHGTVDSIEELAQETLTRCDYVINYRGNFDNDPFLNSGWIQNLIRCSGYDDNNEYNYFIVHETDPRYRGNPDWSVWGTWEYHGLTQSGIGNLVRPMQHMEE